MIARLALILTIAVGAAVPARTGAAEILAVDVELVQAVDASGSVEPDEWRLELDGIAAAIRAPDVVAAIRAGRHGRIAMCLEIWADATRQQDLSDWFMIDSAASAEAFARMVERFPRRVHGGTGIGSAVAEGIRTMQAAPYQADRQIVDVSGDGSETPVREEAAILLPSAIAMAKSFGVTVNGLAITVQEPDLASYYRDHVTTGPGSFVIVANAYADYKDAIHMKLLRELTADVSWLEPARGRAKSRQRLGIPRLAPARIPGLEQLPLALDEIPLAER